VAQPGTGGWPAWVRPLHSEPPHNRKQKEPQVTDTNIPELAGFTIPDTAGSDFELPSYDLTPDEAEAVAGIEHFDPVDDVPSPVQWEGGDIKLPERLTVAMLPPRLADPIKAQLAAMPPAEREAKETGLVFAALRQNAYEVRIKGGISPKAEPHHAEALTIAKEIHALEQEAFRIQTELAEVDHWRPVFDEEGNRVIDPATGQQKVEAVEAVRGPRRAGMQDRLREIEHQVALLNGIEGDRRLAKARKETAQLRLARQRQLAEEAEVQALAEQMARDERIKAKAEARAKRLRDNG
jgi:hypothetical protein